MLLQTDQYSMNNAKDLGEDFTHWLLTRLQKCLKANSSASAQNVESNQKNKCKTKNFFKGCSLKPILSSWLLRKCHRKIMVILENLKNFLYIKADIAQMQFKKDYTPPTKNHKASTAKRWRLLVLNSVRFLDTQYLEKEMNTIKNLWKKLKTRVMTRKPSNIK